MKPSNFRLTVTVFALLAALLLVIGQWSGAVMVAVLTTLLPLVRTLVVNTQESTALLRDLLDRLNTPEESA